jgi:transcriptional regulator with XRE-family HTH domain
MNAAVPRQRKRMPGTVPPKPNKRSTNNVDFLIGRNIRLIRSARDISQEEMAAHLGISFQQVQKYENGKNRVAASRLYEISLLLQVPIGDFFTGVASPSDPFVENFLTTDNLEILTLVNKLETAEQKNIAKKMLRALAS